MPQKKNHPSEGVLNSRVPVSTEVTQIQGPDIPDPLDIAPLDIYEMVVAHSRQVAIDGAVAVLRQNGWRWENFDPGRSGLVPGSIDQTRF